MPDRPLNNKSFRQWFGGSCVTDENGLPLVVYRGEYGMADNHDVGQHTRRGSISFGTGKAACYYAKFPNDTRDIAHAPRVIPAYLRIEKPVIKNDEDPFIDMSDIINTLGWEKAKTIARDLGEFFLNTNNWYDHFEGIFDTPEELIEKSPEELKKLYLDAFPVFDCPDYIEWFREAGYDGVVHSGNGDTAKEIEYKVFSRDSIMLAIETGYMPQSAKYLEDTNSIEPNDLRELNVFY